MIFGNTGIVITSLDEDEYDGDDEGQQQRQTGMKPTMGESGFTISPVFLNAINKKLTRAVDPPTDTPANQALVLFRPLPLIAPPPTNNDVKDAPTPKEEMLDSLIQKQSSPFYVPDPGQTSFVFNDDDMEIEML